MISKPKAFALSLLVLAGLALLAFLYSLHSFVVHPTQQMESAFLKTYNPAPDLERFQTNLRGAQWSSRMNAAAGRQFATHDKSFHGQLAIDPKNWMPLMVSLSESLSTQLANDGAEILSRSGDPRDGFRLDYKMGKSLGSAVISPLDLGTSATQSGGELNVTVNISIEEKWFPKEPGVIGVRVSDNAR
jgi:hypothetical protein